MIPPERLSLETGLDWSHEKATRESADIRVREYEYVIEIWIPSYFSSSSMNGTLTTDQPLDAGLILKWIVNFVGFFSLNFGGATVAGISNPEVLSAISTSLDLAGGPEGVAPIVGSYLPIVDMDSSGNLVRDIIESGCLPIEWEPQLANIPNLKREPVTIISCSIEAVNFTRDNYKAFQLLAKQMQIALHQDEVFYRVNGKGFGVI